MNSMQMEELKEKNIYAGVVDTKDIQSIALNALLKGKDGVSVIDANINDEKHLIITLSDKTKIDAGIIDADKEIDYNVLENLPKINNVEIKGNKSLQELGIQPEGNYVQDGNYVHTDNNFTNEEKSKLTELNNYNDTEIKQSIKSLEENKADKNETYSKGEVTNLINNITYSKLSDKPQIQYKALEENENVFQQINKTVTLEDIKNLIDLGIYQFIPLDMSPYTSRNKLNVHEKLPDGLYIATSKGIIDVISDFWGVSEGSIFIKNNDNLSLFLDVGNLYYAWNTSTKEYEGGYYVSVSEMETSIEEALIDYQKTTFITAVTNVSAQTIAIKPYTWRRTLYSTGITRLQLRFFEETELSTNTDFEARLTIKTSKSDFTYTTPTIDTRFFGTDCNNGVFEPQKGMIYDIDFIWNGVYMMANVTGGTW